MVYLLLKVVGVDLPDRRECANVRFRHSFLERGEEICVESCETALLGSCANLHIPGDGQHSL